MNIKKIIKASAMASVLGATLILGGCSGSDFDSVFNVENNAGITVNDVTISDLAEKLNIENQFSGFIFLGQEEDLASEAIASGLMEEEHTGINSIYFANSSSTEGREELVDIFTQIGATVHWDEEGNPLLPVAEFLVIRDGFTLVRLSDFTILNEEFGTIDENQIVEGINSLFNFVEMINNLNDADESVDDVDYDSEDIELAEDEGAEPEEDSTEIEDVDYETEGAESENNDDEATE